MKINLIRPIKWNIIQQENNENYFRLLIKDKKIFDIKGNKNFFWNELYDDILSKMQNKIKTAVWNEEINLDINYLFEPFNKNDKLFKIENISNTEFIFDKKPYYDNNTNKKEDTPENEIFIKTIIKEVKKDTNSKDINFITFVNKENNKIVTNYKKKQLKEIPYIASFYKKTDKLIFNFEKQSMLRSYRIASGIIIWFEQHLFAYNQYFSYLLELFKLKKIKTVNIDWKEYYIEKLLKDTYLSIIYYILDGYADVVNFSKTKNNFLLLSNYKIYKSTFVYEEVYKYNYKTNKNDIPNGKKYIIDKEEYEGFTFKKVFNSLMQVLIEKKYFFDEYSDFIKTKYLWKKSNKKEYAKVWQENNLRLNNQTNEILVDLRKQLPKEVNDFINLFKWFEIDETTDLWNMSNFFITYYNIMQFIWNKLLLDYKNLVWYIILKIRKLWQYKSTWKYFPDFKILAVDTRTRTSLVHETWHFIHHILADKYNIAISNNFLNIVIKLPNIIIDYQTKKSLLEYRRKNWDLNIEQLQKQVSQYKQITEKYKNIALYFYIIHNISIIPHKNNKYKWISKIEWLLWNLSVIETINLSDKFHNLYTSYQDILNTYKWWWIQYAWTSVEIFARLFDYSISNLLKKESKELYNKLNENNIDIATLDKVSTKTDKIDPQKELSIKSVDLWVLQILEDDLGIKKETIYQEFLDLIKNEINLNKHKIFW